MKPKHRRNEKEESRNKNRIIENYEKQVKVKKTALKCILQIIQDTK